jgi:hypothetical protein
MFLAVVQGGIGYLQYFNGVPEVLVGTHLAGATALWVATVHLVQMGIAPIASGGAHVGTLDARDAAEMSVTPAPHA